VSLFDKLVETALETDEKYAALRPVIEKEILHHDILREMNKAGFLKSLTFIGGTCLRLCYGSERLSEDLDFAGGFDFTKNNLSGLSQLLQDTLMQKYEFPVEVLEPAKETGNTDTWKIKIITRPERSDLPAQRINIDVVMLPSYDRKPSMLKSHYGIESGTSGLILFAESREEIFADKLIALANRPNRVKNRDLWDIFWLNSHNVKLRKDMLEQKLADRRIPLAEFSARYVQRVSEIEGGQQAFLTEMRRFLPPNVFSGDFIEAVWWECLVELLKGLG
jgi:predicted nucleotidyltransferase component of viral defense system